jgi:hypothetical protein
MKVDAELVIPDVTKEYIEEQKKFLLEQVEKFSKDTKVLDGISKLEKMFASYIESNNALAKAMTALADANHHLAMVEQQKLNK